MNAADLAKFSPEEREVIAKAFNARASFCEEMDRISPMSRKDLDELKNKHNILEAKATLEKYGLKNIQKIYGF